MKFTAFMLTILLVGCGASRIAMRGRCGPNTKVNGAAVSSGKRVIVGPPAASVEICGPGKFTFSPMQCNGNFFAHKVQVIDRSTGSHTTDCAKVDLTHPAACYTV